MHKIQNILGFMEISCHKSAFPGDNVPASPGKITACIYCQNSKKNASTLSLGMGKSLKQAFVQFNQLISSTLRSF